MDGDLLARATTACAWYNSFGHTVVEAANCAFVVDPEHPTVWSSNHAFGVTASTPEQIDGVLAQTAQQLAHCSHHVVATDCFTPPAFIARLLLDDFRELTPVVQMALQAGLAPVRSSLAHIRPVQSEEDWPTLYALVEADHREGARTDGVMDAAVTRGIVDGYRKKAGPCQFFLAEMEGRPCAFGAAIVCPNGLGVVEDLFTLPQYRRRGACSALIARCVDHARAAGAGPMLIGARATDGPKHLYARLGFAPLFVARDFVKAV